MSQDSRRVQVALRIVVYVVSTLRSFNPSPLFSLYPFLSYYLFLLFLFYFFSSSQINRSVQGLPCALAMVLATKECACAIILGLVLNVIKVILSFNLSIIFANCFFFFFV